MLIYGRVVYSRTAHCRAENNQELEVVMSKAVKSDGRVNQAINEMCDRGLSSYDKGKVDKIFLDEDMLRQCEHETLCRAFYEYANTYKEKNWHIQKHIEIKAWQSSVYREFMRNRKCGARPTIINNNSDPLDELLQRKK